MWDQMFLQYSFHNQYYFGAPSKCAVQYWNIVQGEIRFRGDKQDQGDNVNKKYVHISGGQSHFWGGSPSCPLLRKNLDCLFSPDICSVLSVSYQNIPHQLLLNYLGGMEDESVSSLISDCGWSLQQKEGGTMVVIGNQEATIRPKKILAKIEFDSELGIVYCSK